MNSKKNVSDKMEIVKHFRKKNALNSLIIRLEKIPFSAPKTMECKSLL